jgi:hypothetical protein
MPGENGQISPSNAGPGCRHDRIRPHPAPLLQERWKSANIPATSRFIWGIPARL